MTDTQLDILDAINADPQPWALDDRDRIHAAQREDYERHGTVNPNRVRKILTNDAGHLTVNPRRLSASYNNRKRFEWFGYVDSDDTAGRNRGARVGIYRFKENPS